MALISLKKIGFAFFCVLSAFCLPACKTTAKLRSSAQLPAAHGYVKIKGLADNHYSVTVHVEDLASPDKLSPPAKFYVVWVQTKFKGTMNIGYLKIDSNKTGSLSAGTVTRPMRFFITPENKTGIIIPGHQNVLTSSSF